MECLNAKCSNESHQSNGAHLLIMIDGRPHPKYCWICAPCLMALEDDEGVKACHSATMPNKEDAFYHRPWLFSINGEPRHGKCCIDATEDITLGLCYEHNADNYIWNGMSWVYQQPVDWKPKTPEKKKPLQIDRWDPDGTLGKCWHCGSEETGFMLLANGMVEPRCDDCGQPHMGMYKTKEEARGQWEELRTALGDPPEAQCSGEHDVETNDP